MRGFLVAALLGVGTTSAWAEVTPFSESYSSTSVTTGWTTGTSGRFTPAILNDDDNYYLSVDQSSRNNNGATVTGTILSGKAAAGDDFTLIFDLRLVSSNNQTNTELKFLDAANSGVIFSLKETNKSVTTWKINGTDTQVTLPSSSDNPTLSTVPWVTCKISRSGSLTYVTMTNKSTDEVIFARATVDGASATGGLGNITFASSRYYANFAIDNIVVREIEDGDVPVVTPTTYTIKYRNESDVEIADDIVTNSYVGAEIEASAAQMAAITYNEQKYIYKSGNTPITLVADAESNVITLVYRAAATYSYTINAVYGGNIIEAVKTGNTFEGDAVSYINKHFYNVGGTLVKKAAVSNSYSASSTPTSDGEVISVEYTKGDKTNIVFLAEAEDIATLTPVSSAYLPERFSGGKGGYAKDEDQVITTLSPGKYKLTAHIMGTASVCTFTFKAGEATIWENATASSSFYPGDGITSEEFTLTENTDIVLVAAGGDGSSSRVTNAVDFIYIERTDIISTTLLNTYGTIASAYALDCANLPTGLTAYQVTSIAADKVTLTQVTEAVAAGTGLILKGTGGETYDIPVVASGTDISATNKLKAAVTATAVDANAAYVLYKDEFRKATNASSVPAGKAYLLATDVPAEARSLTFNFGDATGISAIAKSQEPNANGYYNLAGQRVAQPTKGLYIQDGKKVIIK